MFGEASGGGGAAIGESAMSAPLTPPNREDWLTAAAERLAPMIIAAGGSKPVARVSCGFPSRGGMAPRHLVIGQCWPGRTVNNPDGGAQIFVSPLLADAVEVGAVLLHELIHAACPPKTGHRGLFKRIAVACGLAGKMTATVPGPELEKKLRLIASELGPYPHTPLRRAGGADGGPQDPEEPRQGTRLRLWECACPVKVRVASDDFRAICERCRARFENRSRTMSSPVPREPGS